MESIVQRTIEPGNPVLDACHGIFSVGDLPGLSQSKENEYGTKQIQCA